ncbi:hypothetical protein BS17DRAFT_767432 [Gyrodon lividus]|nr:hypothetical protein BS17DRAFT_767432 [Gyrodon lividus]
MNSNFHAPRSNRTSSEDDSSPGAGVCSVFAFQSLAYTRDAPSTPSSNPAVQAGFVEPDLHHMGYNLPPEEVVMPGVESQTHVGPMFPYIPYPPLTPPTAPVWHFDLTNPNFHFTGYGLIEEGNSSSGVEAQVAGPMFPSSTFAQAVDPVSPSTYPAPQAPGPQVWEAVASRFV